MPLVANVEEGVVVRRPNLEACFLEILSVVKQSFYTRTVRLVVHVDLEAILIIVLSIIGDKQGLERKAEWRQSITEELGGVTSIPGVVENRVNVEQVKSVFKLIIKVRSQLEQECVGVGQHSDRGKSDKDGNLFFVVALPVGKTIEHLGCTLGVADVGDLLMAGQSGNVIE